MNLWLYVQSAGQLYRPDGSFCASGYSGRGDGLNNPAMQEIKDVGPLPTGLYALGTAETHPRLGPIAIPLQPDPLNAMYGRSEFWCHGDNAEANHTASEGCIVMPRLARIELARGGMMRVIDEPAPQEIVA